jgi:hypothetical protein
MSALACSLFKLEAMPHGALVEHLILAIAAALIAGELPVLG